ncbi:sensor domain-containing diguanylate cyclase [Arsukibacterium indicum]|uniref:diguanylate cyclase n=1 Tax=Arsukibacterium indicum TaxID=2848612 RepID=A0ABS6MLA6_9GAMM|nr:sensor domain-containing diguanylate cyclase [Arsukibacterium indicum]MBV2129603.1 GGDEF domain-containing protein [Arsukibacterium indicum]
MKTAHNKTKLQPLALNDDSLWDDENGVASGLDIGSFVQYLAEAVLIVSPDGTIECANAKAALLLNCIGTPLIGRQWPEFLTSRCQQQYEGLVQLVAKRVLSLQAGPSEMALRCADGVVKDIELSVSFLPEPAARLVLVMRDLSRYKAECEQLRLQATTDALTGLANRRGFDEQLHKQWQQCTEARLPLSVVIIDIDFFKQFNDSYGHIQGDACLRKVAAAIVQAMPVDAKLAARYGGEEFALILPNHNEISAIKVARQVQQAVRQLQFRDAGLPVTTSVSVSQGVATEVNGQYRTSMALLCAADTALYRAKAEGRDCINTSS